MTRPDRPDPALVDDPFANAFREGCDAERSFAATADRTPAERAHRVKALEEMIAQLAGMRHKFEGKPEAIEQLTLARQTVEGRLHIARREEERDA